MPGFTLCEDTGMVAVDGACPAHRGDACLREYVPAPRVREAWAAAERFMPFLDLLRRPPDGRAIDWSTITEWPTVADCDALISVADAACACGGAHHCAAELAPVAMAARELINEHHLGDFVYIVRERLDDPAYEGNTWEHPKVTSFARAVETLRAFAESGPPPAPADPTEGTGFDLRAVRAVIESVAPAWVDMSACVAWYRATGRDRDGRCSVCASLIGSDATWKAVDGRWYHACPKVNPSLEASRP